MPSEAGTVLGGERAVTWCGHATVLIETGGARFLTDPLLRGRLGHLTRRARTIEPEHIGRLDAVLISHVHRDHLDLPTLRRLAPGVPLLVPRGAGRHIRGLGEAHEVAPSESTTIAGVTVTATPAVHEASRGGQRSPSLGYVVDGGIYFAGDTGLFPGMSALAPLDLALLPVWGWGTSLGSGAHLDPRSAAEALTLLRPRFAVPIHWGTYFPVHRGRAGHRLLTEPPCAFARHAAEVAPAVDVKVLEPGDRMTTRPG